MMHAFDAILIASTVLAVISIVGTTLQVGISPMPSSRKACQTIASAIPKNTEGPIIDLGSGWGNLVFVLARSFPQTKIKGIELSPIPWAVSQLIALFSPFGNLKIERGNFRDTNLREASVVVCYLFPEGMAYLKNKFERELKPDTLIISNTFRLAGWEPEEIITLDDIYQTPIYRYRIPTQESGKDPN